MLRIKDLREDKDMLQKDVAKLLNISQTNYSKYELGKINIPINTLKKLALIFDTSIDYLLGLTNEINQFFFRAFFIKFAFKKFFCYTVTIMEDKERYKHLNKYLKEKFGERTLKICIDGGFTCPNRDGTISTKGCIFCSEKGSGELIRCGFGNTITEKISNQVKNYFNSYRSERANKFIAYFQNFTNTYESLDILKAKYDSALIDDRIVGL